MSGSLGSVCLFLFFFRTSTTALSMIQKQFTHVFLAIPSHSCLKCEVISLRLDISNCDSSLAVYALEAALNLLPIGFLCIFESGILTLCLVKNSSCSAIRCFTCMLLGMQVCGLIPLFVLSSFITSLVPSVTRNCPLTSGHDTDFRFS